MSYVSTIQIVHKCSGCGKKMPFVNTGKFRVNANGSKVDVWLIYQCAKCRHSLNLTIYERIRPGRIPEEDFQKFQENDEDQKSGTYLLPHFVSLILVLAI